MNYLKWLVPIGLCAWLGQYVLAMFVPTVIMETLYRKAGAVNGFNQLVLSPIPDETSRGVVRPSPDLKSATVFVTPLGGGGGGDVKAVVKALKRAKGYIRSELGRKVEAKFTPDLRFVPDETFDRGQRIDGILSDVAAKDAARPMPGGSHGT